MKKLDVKINGKDKVLFLSDSMSIHLTESEARESDKVFQKWKEYNNLISFPENEKIDFEDLDAEKIPEGIYCRNCPYLTFIGYKIFHRNLNSAEEIAKAFKNGEPANTVIKAEVCSVSDKCDKECWSTGATNCKSIIYGCKFLNVIDEDQNTLLWDGCKECEINIPDN